MNGERNIDDELLSMWNRKVTNAVTTTRTKIRAVVSEVVDPIVEKVQEHDGLLGGLFKQMTASFGGMMRLDEKLKKGKK